MKIKGQLFTLLLVVTILLLAFSGLAFSQEEGKMKKDQYKVQLADAQSREAAATERIATLDAENQELEQQIAELQTEIDAVKDATYALLGTDRAGVQAYRDNLNSIDGEIDGLAALDPEELFRRKSEIKDIEAEIQTARESKIATLSEMDEKLAALDAKVADLKASLPANIYDQYVVIKGDYLWKISKKDEIYGDPYQWIRIYCVNKDQIKNPDLIHPDQVFNIARGVGMNEYLVVKGDWLAKIAACPKVLNDPTKWTKLYEANKDIVSDPNLIYPHQVLTLPAE
jgi:nucleoid-associated protein YgaU